MSRPEKVAIESDDGLRLAGILHTPSGDSQTTLVLAHCFTCSKDYKLMAWLARHLSERGRTVLRFDFRGLGQSEGDFAASTLSDDRADLIAACRWLDQRSLSPQALVGHSMGGAAAILAAGSVASVEAVAAIGTPAEPGNITRILTEEQRAEIDRAGVAQVPVVGRPHPISRRFLDDLKRHSLEEAMDGWGRRLAVVHSTEDELISVDRAEQLYRIAPRPRAFFPLIGADHLISNRDHARRTAGFLDAWLG